MKKIKYTILYRGSTFVIPFYYDLEPYLIMVPVPLRSVSKLQFRSRYSKKITVPTVPVPVSQHCLTDVYFSYVPDGYVLCCLL